MNKNLSKWFPWVVLAVVVVIALFFVDFSKVNSDNKTVSEKVEAVIVGTSIEEINDDDAYNEAFEEGIDEDFEDINQ